MIARIWYCIRSVCVRTFTRCSACPFLDSVLPHSSFLLLLCMRWMLKKYIKKKYLLRYVRSFFRAQSFYFQLRSLQSTLFTHRRHIGLKRFKAFAFRNVPNVIWTERVKRNWLRWHEYARACSVHTAFWVALTQCVPTATRHSMPFRAISKNLDGATSFGRVWQNRERAAT